MRKLGLVVALSILLIGCGGGDDDDGGATSSGSSTSGGNDEVCMAVDDVESAVTKVQNLDSNSSIADVESAISGVGQAADELANAVETAPSPDLSNLKSSVQNLDDALKAVPSSETLGAGLQKVESAADSVAEEAKTTANNVGCS
jgi:hypothetical protein